MGKVMNTIRMGAKMRNERCLNRPSGMGFWLIVCLSMAISTGAALGQGKQQLVNRAVASFQDAERDGSISGMLDAAHNVLVRIPGDPTGAALYGAVLSYLEEYAQATRVLTHPTIDSSSPIVRSALERIEKQTTKVSVTFNGPDFSDALTQQLVKDIAALATSYTPRVVIPPAEKKQVSRLRRSIASTGKVTEAKITRTTKHAQGQTVSTLAVVKQPELRLVIALSKHRYEDVNTTLTRVREGDGTSALGAIINLNAYASISFKGANNESKVGLKGRTLKAEGGTYRVPAGRHDFTVTVGKHRFPVVAELQWGDKKELTLPGMLRVSTTLQPMDIHIGKEKSTLLADKSTHDFFVAADKPAHLHAATPKRSEYKKTVTLKPGEVVTVALGESQLPMDTQWIAYENNSSSRTMAWALIGTGIATAAATGVGAWLSSNYAAQADSAYADYKSAANYPSLNSTRAQTDDLDASAALWSYVAIGAGVATAALITTGTILLIMNPGLDEPATKGTITQTAWIPVPTVLPAGAGITWRIDY